MVKVLVRFLSSETFPEVFLFLPLGHQQRLLRTAQDLHGFQISDCVEGLSAEPNSII